MSNFKIIWTQEAENDYDAIYEYYILISSNIALKILNSISESVDNLVFEKQFQTDNINPNYRRIISGNYKILYRVENDKIIIFAIFDTRQNPIRLEKIRR